MSVCIVSASATLCLYGVLHSLSLVICPLVHLMFVSPIKPIFFGTLSLCFSCSPPAFYTVLNKKKIYFFLPALF